MQTSQNGQVVATAPTGGSTEPPLVATNPDAATQATAAATVSGDLPSHGTTSPDGKTIIVPTKAMNRIRQEERERGKQQAMDEYAKSQGFSTSAEMTAFVAEQKSAKAAPAKTNGHTRPDVNGKDTQRKTTNGNGAHMNGSGKTNGSSKSPDKTEKYRARWEQEKLELRKTVRREMTKSKTLQHQLDAKEAEMHLREAAAMEGIQDVDYAIRLVTRDLEGRSDEEISAFDERKFFAQLRKDKPYLAGEVVRPATTGTGAAGVPAPTAGDMKQAAAAVQQVDARKMSKQDYARHLQSRNFDPNM